jgi:hypothetical protein
MHLCRCSGLENFSGPPLPGDDRPSVNRSVDWLMYVQMATSLAAESPRCAALLIGVDRLASAPRRNGVLVPMPCFKHLEVDLPLAEPNGQLQEVPSGAHWAGQAGDNERVAGPGPCRSSAAGKLAQLCPCR